MVIYILSMSTHLNFHISRQRVIDGMNVVHEIALKPRSGLDEPSKFDEMKKGPFDESRGRGTEAPHPGIPLSNPWT